MSHVNIYKAKILNPSLFAEIVKKKFGIDCTMGKHKARQYGNNIVDSVLSVTLPEWRYPISVKENGDIAYDHFGATNSKKAMANLGRTIQEYYIESVKSQADYTVVTGIDQYELENGDVQLVVNY